MITLQRFLSRLESFIGVPVHHRGFSRLSGVDCVGLGIAVLAEEGEVIPYDPTHGTLPSEETMTAGLSQYCRRLEAPRLGCLLQMQMGTAMRHAAFWLDTVPTGEIVVIEAMGRHKTVRTRSLQSGTQAIPWWPNQVEDA